MLSSMRSTGRNVLVVLALALLGGKASACPGCREAVLDNSHDRNAREVADPASGFSWSIYLMISVPYLTLGGLGFYFVRMAKKHQRTLDTIATSCDSSQLQFGAKGSS